jgi:hypothetical protein
MYNINYEVKYHDIEKALLMNLQKRMETRLARENGIFINDEMNTKLDIEDNQEFCKDCKGNERQNEDENNNEKDNNGNNSDDEDDDDEEYEYTLDDVYTICEKLYRDELLSVFNVQSISDENIDAGIKAAIEQMIDNESFRKLLDDIKVNLIDFDNFVGTPEELENMKRNSEYLIFISLFSQKLFYLTHICLCQLFTVGEISPDLLSKIKEKTIGLFKQ